MLALGVLLALAVLCGRGSAARAARPLRSAADGTANGAPPAPATPPAELVALEQKMATLPVVSERYTQLTHLTVTTTTSTGAPARPRNVNAAISGLASLTPLQGEARLSGRPWRIGIGPRTYDYSASAGRMDGGRPWIRQQDESAASLFPYHAGAGSRYEIDAGGKGPYAGLLDLLWTAVGEVTRSEATIDGRHVIGFTVAVDRLALIKSLRPSVLERGGPMQTLTVYLTESGLPLRVIESTATEYLVSTTTTDILAVDPPVLVAAPSARLTIGLEQLRRLRAAHERRAAHG
ncbi:MAG TPA: hypothetical protein VHW67_13580 [Solirubrobacteraceae bacterium]|jgi:hypothetical protein|nr:hypothetical protein [Solirubrobacteraceae bacterium]